MTKQRLKIIASISLTLISVGGFAQGDSPPPPMPPPPPGLPIDNAIIALFFAALVFGIYKKTKISKSY